MTKYGQAAVNAVSISKIQNFSPSDAWDKSCKALGTTQKAKYKPCPRTVFLGLCEQGYVKGISKGKYLKRNDQFLINKYRALALRENIFSQYNGQWPTKSADHLWKDSAIFHNFNNINQIPVKGDQGGIGVTRELLNSGLLQ